ncbi:MAG: OsmC family protein [Actinomycetota bacterium]|nr:OsmC family protein [Actinomycetota bacterium]
MAAPRSGTAKWNGDLKGGSGDLQVGDGVFQGAYTFQSRFEEGQGTNPEELIAAAHAACYSMELSNILAEHGHEPRSVQTSAKVELRIVDGAPTITKIALTTEGDVPGLDEDHFHEHAEEARASCLVSRALAGAGEITLEAKLNA